MVDGVAGGPVGGPVEIVFARAFSRHVDCPDAEVVASSVGEALAAYFADRPAVRAYVLDESGAVRRHVAVFRNADQIGDRAALTDPVAPGDRIHVFQALSGGA